ncbi:sirohydrochlorin chelatase [Nocardia donostiensis]|uniref:Cobalamin biosynthesis protein CbiX n=1 Tax=Nocardia donostiensis TaxID=1538463 RepID=A0A1W0BCV7_9NOCA|nr:sirohydrochlorin chelatase [Nocardia donostiensis]ONM48104.1 cobalamin biosynthesis protein CbiX [Nocardia donostiensis]OQS20334.1 cobalamin biosynthesis protein CbiX [Nocardia donostiensis]
MSAPALVLVAHGTRSAEGVEMIAALAEAVSRELTSGAARAAGISGAKPVGAPTCTVHRATPPVRTAFVDVLGPSPSEVLKDLSAHPEPAIVVPAFLASGYHVYQDVPREVADSGHSGAVVTPAMGPDPALICVMAMRLRAAGWQPGDAVVFAAAGSSDPRARRDVRRATAMLAEHLGTPVHPGYIATGAPRVPDVVRAVRASGEPRVFVASYLLAHGLFQQRLHEAGATAVADPIGVHPAVVRLIAGRYRTACRELVVSRSYSAS